MRHGRVSDGPGGCGTGPDPGARGAGLLPPAADPQASARRPGFDLRRAGPGSALALLAGLLAATHATAQSGPTETLGQVAAEITGAGTTIAGDWRLIARADRDDPDLIGASVRLERDAGGTMVTIRLNALPAAAPAPAGVLRGNSFLRLDLFFDLPAGAALEDLADAAPLDAAISFVEVWPGNVAVPALQYATMFSPVATDITRLEPVEDGLRMEGRATGNACLFAFHRDDSGDWAPAEARVMGVQPCVDIDLRFTTRVPRI